SLSARLPRRAALGAALLRADRRPHHRQRDHALDGPGDLRHLRARSRHPHLAGRRARRDRGRARGRRGARMNAITRIAAVLVALTCAGASACTLVRSHRELGMMARAATLDGEVHSPSAETKPILVFLLTEHDGKLVPLSRYVRYGSG